MATSRTNTRCGRCRGWISYGEKVVRTGKVSWHTKCMADYLRERRARREAGAG